MFVSGVQQSDSVIQIDVSIFFQVLFPFRSLQSTEQSFLCHTVGPLLVIYLINLFKVIYLFSCPGSPLLHTGFL